MVTDCWYLPGLEQAQGKRKPRKREVQLVSPRVITTVQDSSLHSLQDAESERRVVVKSLGS
jgi:hypothetical protein